MKKFLKENSYFIVKFVVYQLGVMIMGLVTAMATVNVELTWLYPVSSLFCVAFYLFLIGLCGYETGQKDGIRIEAGKIRFNPMRFFLVGLCANALNLLLGFLSVLFRLILNAPMIGSLNPEMIYTPEWAASAYSVCHAIALFIQSMYLGLIQTISFDNVWFLLVIPIPAILAAGISYLVGIRCKDGLFPKKDKNDKNKGTKRYS